MVAEDDPLFGNPEHAASMAIPFSLFHSALSSLSHLWTGRHFELLPASALALTTFRVEAKWLRPGQPPLFSRSNSVCLPSRAVFRLAETKTLFLAIKLALSLSRSYTSLEMFYRQTSNCAPSVWFDFFVRGVCLQMVDECCTVVGTPGITDVLTFANSSTICWQCCHFHLRAAWWLDPSIITLARYDN